MPVTGYHAHVYYGPETIDQARALCEAARDKFSLPMGRMHERPVGPHPEWSCQLTVEPDQFGTAVPWLSENRDGLVVFVHGLSGEDLKDHTEHVIWLCGSATLNLAMFGG